MPTAGSHPRGAGAGLSACRSRSPWISPPRAALPGRIILSGKPGLGGSGPWVGGASPSPSNPSLPAAALVIAVEIPVPPPPPPPALLSICDGQLTWGPPGQIALAAAPGPAHPPNPLLMLCCRDLERIDTFGTKGQALSSCPGSHRLWGGSWGLLSGRTCVLADQLLVLTKLVWARGDRETRLQPWPVPPPGPGHHCPSS